MTLNANHATSRRYSELAPAVAPEKTVSPYYLQFSNFVVIPEARLLLCGGRPVTIGSRAFDLLVTLVQHRGQILSKERIIAFVWPSTTVDECNLRFQMVLLRKVLGREARLIKTIPGRGYLLAVDVPSLDLAETQ
jgi:DNA-binding winged helix-turn-helix (wHTH) protein